MVDVFIIIVNWNTAEILRECLRSIQKNTVGIAYRVCVVDNGSTDGSAEMIATEFPSVRLIRNETNLGFAAANNQGIRIAEGRYVLLLNSDTQVTEGALDTMVAFADQDSNLGILGPRLVGIDGSVELSAAQFPSLFKSLIVHFPLLRYLLSKEGHSFLTRTDQCTVPCDVGFVNGAGMLVRREAIAQVGVLDEDYFMYGEDLDWCYRMRKHGWRVVYAPQAEIVHLRNRSGAAKWGDSRMAAHRLAEQLFYRKSYGKVTAAAFRFMLMFTSLVRYVRHFALCRILSGDKRAYHYQAAESHKRVLYALVGSKKPSSISEQPD